VREIDSSVQTGAFRKRLFFDQGKTPGGSCLSVRTKVTNQSVDR
jgi:hypothetical protein